MTERANGVLPEPKDRECNREVVMVIKMTTFGRPRQAQQTIDGALKHLRVCGYQAELMHSEINEIPDA